MATRKLSFPIVLEQNQNDQSTAYGKYFPQTYSPKEALNLKGLIQLVAMDQSVFSEDIARGVIDRLGDVMVELLSSGQSVKWDGLGTFRPTVESKGKSNVNEFDLNTDVVGIHVRFIPQNDKGEELTSRKFADLCTFNCVGAWEKKKVVVKGKTVITRKLIPTKDIGVTPDKPNPDNP